MEDGTPWPGNNTTDHTGMIQVCAFDHLILGDRGTELLHYYSSYVSRYLHIQTHLGLSNFSTPSLIQR